MNIFMLEMEQFKFSSGIGRFMLCCSKAGKHGPVFGLKIIVVCLLLSFQSLAQQAERYYIQSSSVQFLSDASLEKINAVSTDMRGVIDLNSNSFAFSIANTSFKGFNSPLQSEHFNENYMESERYPKSTFNGKLIDEVDFKRDGVYTVRAKGILNIKGVGQERIINSTVSVRGKEVFISSDFTILLSDHEIRIPRIVQQKIAPEIKVKFQAKLTGGEKR